MRQQIKAAGGLWNPDLQVWTIRYDRVVTLGLKNRIVEEASCYIEEHVFLYVGIFLLLYLGTLWLLPIGSQCYR
jgi:hypothetical protein